MNCRRLLAIVICRKLNVLEKGGRLHCHPVTYQQTDIVAMTHSHEHSKWRDLRAVQIIYHFWQCTNATQAHNNNIFFLAVFEVQYFNQFH